MSMRPLFLTDPLLHPLLVLSLVLHLTGQTVAGIQLTINSNSNSYSFGNSNSNSNNNGYSNSYDYSKGYSHGNSYDNDNDYGYDNGLNNSCPAITGLQLAACNTDCGRVEVSLARSEWRGVCSSTWTKKEASVVCRQLGFPKGGAVTSFKARQEIGLEEVICRGDEKTVDQCQIQLGSKKCQYVAGVFCSAVEEGGMQEELVEENLFVRLEEAEERRRRRVDTWLDHQTYTCKLPQSFPNPFNLSLLEEAYIYSSQVVPLWQKMSKQLESAFCHPEHGSELIRQMEVLVEAGLKWNALGLTLPHIKEEESMVAGIKMTKEEEEEVISSLYLVPSQHTTITWDLDVLRAPSTPPNPTDDQVALARDGILKVEDWGLPEDLLVKLSSIATKLLTSGTSTYFPDLQAHVSSTSGGTVSTARLPLPSLETWLIHDSTIPDLVAGYLGSSPVLSGYKLTRLSTTLEEEAEENYIAGLWHHDKTGRRLKMFVYLHDIDCEEGHPTEVALGTHNLVYFATDSFPVSRFRDDYVRRSWNTTRGCGSRGGGFIFDTHSIHKGTPFGAQARSVLILEFHPAGKCAVARRLKLGLPCPSGDQYVVNKSL